VRIRETRPAHGRDEPWRIDHSVADAIGWIEAFA
jgi:hypothetical protein